MDLNGFKNEIKGLKVNKKKRIKFKIVGIAWNCEYKEREIDRKWLKYNK